jgi:hypothetical protein
MSEAPAAEAAAPATGESKMARHEVYKRRDDDLYEPQPVPDGELLNERLLSSTIVKLTLGEWNDEPTVMHEVVEVSVVDPAHPETVGRTEAWVYRKENWLEAYPPKVRDNSTELSKAAFRDRFRHLRIPNFMGVAHYLK